MFVLFTSMLVLALVPSTSVALVVVRSSSAGFLNGCAVSAGIVVGDLVFVGLAIWGMAAIADVMGSFFLLIRYLAGAYLIWFGLSLIRSTSTLPLGRFTATTPGLSISFLSGLLLTLGDIKAILFYASLFPAFVDLASITALEVMLIVLVTAAAVGSVKLGYAYFAVKLSAVALNHSVVRVVKPTAGGLMVGAGSYLIAKA